MSNSLVWFFLIWIMCIFPILFHSALHCTLQLTPNYLQFTNSLYSFYRYSLSINYALATVLSLVNSEVNMANMAHLHRIYSQVLKEFILLFTVPSCAQNAWRTLLNFWSSFQGSTSLQNPTRLPPPWPTKKNLITPSAPYTHCHPSLFSSLWW